jgi:flagellar biosynthesis/type III secretory pathway chaperone
MDPTVCRETLAALLGEEAGLLGKLEAVLEREHEVLQTQDVDALNTTALLRQELIGGLARIEEQRRSLCRMHAHTADLPGLEKLLRWCDPSGSLMARLRVCADGASRCRDLNDRNGALVNVRLKRVEGALAVLTGRGQEHTYGPKGAYSASRKGRVLGAA